MEIVPVEVMIKSAASPNTLRTHLSFFALHAVVVRLIVAALRVAAKRKLAAHGPSFQRFPSIRISTTPSR
jgi:hypothetical protein